MNVAYIQDSCSNTHHQSWEPRIQSHFILTFQNFPANIPPYRFAYSSAFYNDISDVLVQRGRDSRGDNRQEPYARQFAELP